MLEARKPTQEELDQLARLDWLFTFQIARSQAGIVVLEKLPVEEPDPADPCGIPIQVERKVLVAIVGHDPIVTEAYVWRNGDLERSA